MSIHRIHESVLLATLFAGTVWACGSAAMAAPDPAPAPGLLLARYTAALDDARPVPERRAAALDIEASLPKTSKRGRLQAIRRWVRLDRPEYQVLHSEGDRSVTQQVIGRYLSAESQAETLPASLVAVSPANYKFHYICSIGTAGSLTYVYRITPRRKRVGLMQGELWIDVSTGIVVRQSGRLVKNPSMFLRRVDMVQDTDIRQGRPYLRITRLNIDARLFGQAELTIREHPCGQGSEPGIAAFASNAAITPNEEDAMQACLVDQ